jgi:hypothetical protein
VDHGRGKFPGPGFTLYNWLTLTDLRKFLYDVFQFLIEQGAGLVL